MRFNVTGHQAPASSMARDEQVDDKLKNFREHQKNAARLSFGEEAKTLVHYGRYGVISTISRDPQLSGFPFGSVVGYAPDEDSLPIFALSNLSAHTQVLCAAVSKLTLFCPRKVHVWCIC